MKADRAVAAAWRHDDLASDLTAHLRGYARPMMIWENMQLGPSGSIRPDVYALVPSYTNIAATVYEVKISRSDFLSDVTSGKSLRYIPYCSGVIFAVPKGMVKPEELPNGFGLIERSDKGWRHVRKAKRHSCTELPQETWMKLVIDGIQREQGLLRRPQPKRAAEYQATKIANKVLGAELGALFENRATAKTMLQYDIDRLAEQRSRVKQEAEAERNRASETAQRELLSVRQALDAIAADLGLEQGASAYSIRDTLSKLRPDHDRQTLAAIATTLERQSTRAAEDAADLRRRLGATP